MNPGLVLKSCRESDCITSWQERYSDAHLLAVASEACCTLQLPRPDLQKVDWYLTHEEIAVPVFIQLKTLVGGKPVNGGFSYRIDRKLYNKFRVEDVHNRFILLLVLPPKSEPWMEQHSTHLAIRQCLYWINLSGAPAPQDDKSGKVTVHFPLTQIASPEWLMRVYAAIGEGKTPKEVRQGC